MVSLILLPVLAIAALSVLLYLFFRRLPEVEARARMMSDTSSEPLFSLGDRLKKFFLMTVEWLVRWFKIFSLRAYNQLGILAASAKEARIRAAARIVERKSRQKEPVSPATQVFPASDSKRADFSRNRGIRRRDGDILGSEEDLSPRISTTVQMPDSNESVRVSPAVQKWFGQGNREALSQQEPASLPGENAQGVGSRAAVDPIGRGLSARNEALHDERAIRRRASDIGKKFGTVVRSLRPNRTLKTPAEQNLPEVPMKKDQLEDILVERISMNPRDIEAYERLGDYYLEQGNLSDAKECYRQVLKLSPAYRLVKIKIRRLERLLEKERLP